MVDRYHTFQLKTNSWVLIYIFNYLQSVWISYTTSKLLITVYIIIYVFMVNQLTEILLLYISIFYIYCVLVDDIIMMKYIFFKNFIEINVLLLLLI